MERQLSCPDGATPGVPGGLAYDNYDEQTHTSSGADTLHDTTGIFYQVEVETVVPPTTETTAVPKSVEMPPRKGKKRRRALDVPSTDIESCRKKPHMSCFSYTDTNIRGLTDFTVHARKLNFLWMAAHTLERENTPMWVGFNALFHADHLPKQNVLYMPSIHLPPTRAGVVAETMRITQECAKECGQPHGVASYDLDMAGKALKIQVTDQANYSDIFILSGSFHLQMCPFRAVWKIINESGLQEMLVEAEVLASRSVRGFIKCTNFNRCKRLHPILAMVLEMLHFRKFFAT